MTLEKKIAITSVVLCLLTPLVFSIHLVSADSDLLAQPEPPLGQILLFFFNISFIFFTNKKETVKTKNLSTIPHSSHNLFLYFF